eukprot:TRINITY_DN627_c0_g1_i1.p1 TRINITY_DN627_c0_g1~~TRINITY_DN627_c0_g1_i1.p1  ORF type:complete len:335 (+),score=54.39 TRINITY_DN627_c0_g1_i1:821-1825(+)
MKARSLWGGRSSVHFLCSGIKSEAVRVGRSHLGYSQRYYSNSQYILSLSPAVKVLIDHHRINPDQIHASGPNGRILKGDVIYFLEGKIPPGSKPVNKTKVPKLTPTPSPPTITGANYEDVPISEFTKIQAANCLRSKQTIPHIYLSVECNVDRLLKTCASLQAQGINVSLEDFSVHALASTLQQVPEANATWSEDSIKYFSSIDISATVGSPNGTLVTPVIQNADKKGVLQISEELAQKSKSDTQDNTTSTASIANLGSVGVDMCTELVNPHHACTFVLGSPSKKVVPVGNGIGVATLLPVSLSCDNRVVSVEVAGRLLELFSSHLSCPETVLH